MHCGISLLDHVPHVNILWSLSCKTKDSGGYAIFRMPHDRLPKKLLSGEVKGARPLGRPRSSFTEVVLRDCQNCHISIGMLRTNCSGEEILALHIPSSL